MSRTPEIKMGVLLGHSPSGKQALVTWAWVVVPTGMSLRGPDMSLDTRLLTSRMRQRVQTGLNPWLWA